MKNYEQLLREALHRSVRGMDTKTAVSHLLQQGLVNRTACERLVVRSEVSRLAREGVPRCEALHVVADTCCCSYEKARGLFYNKR